MKQHSRIPAIGILVVLLGFRTCTAQTESADVQAIESAYRADVRPVLVKHCFHCHGRDVQEGDVRLDTLSVDFLNGPAADLERWHDVLRNLHRGEMPPSDEPRLSDNEHGLIVDWLNAAFVSARKHRESTGGRTVMRRLTAYEFENTLEDLLGVSLDIRRDLLPEVPSRDGFLNNGSYLTTSSQHVRDLLAAARQAMEKAIVVGPQPEVYRAAFGGDQIDPFGKGRRRKKGEQEAPRKSDSRYVLGPDQAVYVPVPGIPARGRFRIRVNAHVSGPPTHLLAWFKLSTNNQNSIIVAKPEVRPRGGAQNIDIFGNVEDHPILAEFAATGTLRQNWRLCLSNVNNIHFFRGGNGSSYPKAATRTEAISESVPEDATVSAVRVNSIEIQVPYFEDWPPRSHQQILFDSPNSADETTYAREVIAAFMQRAYRRPVKASEVDTFVESFDAIRPEFDTLEDAMRETLARVLVSPPFLFLVEPRQPSQKVAQLTDYEWATRLACFLWNSRPDDELLRLAGEGKLQDAGKRRDQVLRLLKDNRSRRFVETFTDQWWGLPLLDQVAVNPEFHPNFSDDLKEDMRREAQLFFAEFLDNDISCLKMVDADFTYVTNRLAAHYGIRPERDLGQPLGSGFMRVVLPPESHRSAGILTQGATLLMNSDGVESHPIKRAVWVRNVIFDDPPPDPPADVPELQTEDRATSDLTLRQRIAAHRESQSCYHCHRRVDPWGLPFEEYDALGRFRTEYGRAVASTRSRQAKKPRNNKGRNRSPERETVSADFSVESELPDGHIVTGVDGLKDYILTHGRQRFARAIVRKTLAYALGRSLEISDQPVVEELTKRFEADDYRYKSLIMAIVESEPFRTK